MLRAKRPEAAVAKVILAVCLVALVFVGCAQTDAGIRGQLETRFAADDMVNQHQIVIESRDGIVTLTGVVSSGESKERAGQIAASTDGVEQVINNLEVSASAPPTAGPRTDVPADLGRVGEILKEAAEETGAALKEVPENVTEVAEPTP
jgi:hypothetical protein